MPSRRIQRACQLCHVTKVRCDAVAGSGNPCSNCDQKGAKCVVDQRARKRRRVQLKTLGMFPKKAPGAMSPATTIVSMLFPAPSSERRFSPYEYQRFPSPDPAAGWPDVSLSPTTPDLGSFKNLPFQQPEEEVWNAFTNLGSPLPSSEEEENPEAMLPRFIQPLPMMMSPANIECLYTNGVFSLPGIPLQDALLQTFIDCVFPSMPIVELSRLLGIIQYRDNGADSISLLLFYAVLMSATTFVDQGYLYEAGFSSRTEAQECFYRKAKLLYETEYELNALTIVQSLLLLSYRLQTGDGLDSRHWTSVAISTAQSIGLFDDASTKHDLTFNQGLWKRIAWSCYVTDCQTALKLRCVPFITGPEFHPQLLTEEDFDLCTPSDPSIPGFNLPQIQDICTQQALNALFIAQTQLCTSINDVLQLQAKHNTPAGSPSIPSPPHSLEDSENSARVSATEARLAEWATSFPVVDLAKTENPTLFLQRNILHLQFYTAIAVFYQSQHLPSSGFCVKYASQQITRIATMIHQHNLHTRLPVIGVTAILVAIIIQISEIRSQSADSGESMQNFHAGLEVLRGLSDVYREASQVTSWASKMMDSLSLDGGNYAYSERRSSAPHVDMAYPAQMESRVLGVQ
ncbi:hypothetical protein N7470_006879 [Penicillium chermesinum]|nr:hypothetical protein N7470_006879 [Penicillium chermesinum]